MKIKDRLILLFLLFPLLLSGCSNKDIKRHYYNYQGENENWKAEFIVNATVTFTENKGSIHVDSESEEIFILKYKGELSDLASVRFFEYGYESPIEGGKSSSEYSEENPINTKTFKLSSGGRNGALPTEDSIYTVTVNMDGMEQSFDLQFD